MLHAARNTAERDRGWEWERLTLRGTVQQAEGNTAERDRGWEWERLTLRGTVQQAAGNTAEGDRGWDLKVNTEGDGATGRGEYSWKGQWLGLGERGMHRITRFTPCKQTNKQTNKPHAIVSIQFLQLIIMHSTPKFGFVHI